MKPSSDELYHFTKINIEFKKLQSSIERAIKNFGLYPFNYNSREKDESYLSASLNWNPNAIDSISSNPHQATLGSSIGKFKSIDKYQTEENTLGRNTYNDSYAFVSRTPFSMQDDLGKFLDNFKRTIIRSRISLLNSSYDSTKSLHYGWHNDEETFINLRINVPIKTTSNYVIQILSDNNRDSAMISEFSMNEGYAYVYDTHKYHRAFCKTINPINRLNLIVGISPWFDFNPESNEWCSNEFYGEIHPLDMLNTKNISLDFGTNEF